MTKKLQHLPAKQFETWTQEAHERVQAGLPAEYPGVAVIQEKISALRQAIGEIFRKTCVLPVAFPQDLAEVCSRVDTHVASFVHELSALSDIPDELKDFAAALVRSEQKKVRKFIAEGYDFSDTKDVFMGVSGLNERAKIRDFFACRNDAIFFVVSYEHMVELNITQFVDLDGTSSRILEQIPSGVDKDLAKKLRRNNDAVGYLYDAQESIFSYLENICQRKIPLSFEQFRASVFHYLRKSKERVQADTRMDPKAKSYFFERLHKIEAIYRDITQDEFVNYPVPQDMKSARMRDFVAKIFTAHEEEYRALAENHRPVVSQQDVVIMDCPQEENVPVQVPIFDDLETTIDSLPPAADADFQARVAKVLGWIGELPKTSRHSYVRNDIKALQQILEDQACYDQRLVMFALLRLEAFMKSSQIVTVKGRGAVITNLDQSDIVSFYRDVFDRLEHLKGFSAGGIPAEIDETLDALKEGAETIQSQQQALKDQALEQREQSRREIEDLGLRLSQLMKEHDDAEGELAQLKKSLTEALEKDDFDTLKALSPRSSEFKEKVRRLHVQWEEMEALIASKRRESEERAQVSAREQHAFDEALKSCETQRLSLEQSLAEAVEQSRAVENTGEDVPPSSVLS